MSVVFGIKDCVEYTATWNENGPSLQKTANVRNTYDKQGAYA